MAEYTDDPWNNSGAYYEKFEDMSFEVEPDPILEYENRHKPRGGYGPDGLFNSQEDAKLFGWGGRADADDGYETDEKRRFWSGYGAIFNIIWYFFAGWIFLAWIGNIFSFGGNYNMIMESSIISFFIMLAFHTIWSLFIWIPFAFGYHGAWRNHKIPHIVGGAFTLVYWIGRAIGAIGRALR